MTAQQELRVVDDKMTNEEKILFIYNKIRDIDNEIVSMDYENKSEEDSLLFMDLVLGKKTMLGLLKELGHPVD